MACGPCEGQHICYQKCSTATCYLGHILHILGETLPVFVCGIYLGLGCYFVAKFKQQGAHMGVDYWLYLLDMPY